MFRSPDLKGYTVSSGFLFCHEFSRIDTNKKAKEIRNKSKNILIVSSVPSWKFVFIRG